VARTFRIGRLRISAQLTQRWRARLRAQRRWWRERRRGEAGEAGEVLFPAAGQGMVAVRALGGSESAPGHPRIAILHATAGSGHKSAAQSLAAALARLDPGSAVREVDTLVFASRLYRSTYAASYNAMAARAPRLWGALYRSWALAPVNKGTAPVRLALDRLNLRRLVRVVEREHPDVIVCTHFLPVEALSPRRGRGSLRVPLFCVITDFAAHPFWAFPHVDRYFVASEEVAAELAGHGVARERIEVSGIPVDPRFTAHFGRPTARLRFGLVETRPAVLLMGGGSGVGPLADLAERLAGLAARPQVLVVCGTNPRLLSRIQALARSRPDRGDGPDVTALGFTREVDVLLEACDLLVGKAGGLTCSEALIKGVPLVIFKPTPGQEVRNADYLERHGAARHADSIDEVAATVDRWLGDPAELARRRAAALALARPHAAETIARRVLEAAPSLRRMA
jgi:processive 1,2-diacylglycerol beta-glucosyltransferase